MAYLIYIIITTINIYYSYFHKFKNINREDKYFILKENTKRKETLNYLKLINNTILIVNTITIILFLILQYKINILDIIGYFIHLLSYTVLINSKNYIKMKKSKETLKITTEQKNNTIINYLSIITIILTQRVGDSYNSTYIMIIYLLTILFIIISLKTITKFLKQNKNIVCFKQNREVDYLEDIKFNKKICLNNTANYVAFIIVYIFLIYINLPYIWILYIFTCLLLLYIILDKVKKFKYQTDKLIKNIYILNNSPGIKYAFDFYKDIIKAKNLLLATTLFITTIIVFYLNTTAAFTIVTIQLFNIYLYNILSNKKKLINYIGSLNEDFIDKTKLSVEKNFPINCIEEINILKTKFYKVIYMDLNENIYSSNLILYDPENILNNIKVYINPYNQENDYIMIIKELYE